MGICPYDVGQAKELMDADFETGIHSCIFSRNKSPHRGRNKSPHRGRNEYRYLIWHVHFFRFPDLHDEELVFPADEPAADYKTAFLEASLGADIPVKGAQVNPAGIGVLEKSTHQRLDYICTVASAPVVPFSDKDAELEFLLNVVDVKAAAVSNMLAIFGLDG